MARRITASEGPTSSDPREVFDRHIGIITSIKKDADDKHDAYRKAHASYRSALKLAKRDGIDLDALTDVLKIQKEDPADVDRRFRNTNNYLIWLGIPIGTQLGMDFKTGETVATVVDREAVNGRAANESFEEQAIDSSPAMIARAYNEGHVAGSSNQNLKDCPYRAPVNAKLKVEWEKGWSDAQADIAQSLAPPKKVASGKVARGAAAERTTRKSGASTKKKKAHDNPGLALQ
jgi:ribosome modulation factor